MLDTTKNGIEVSLESWPQLTVTYGIFSNEDYRLHLEDLRLRLETRPPGAFVLLVNILNGRRLDAELRKRSVDFWNEISPKLKGELIAMAYVVDNAVIRGVIQAISWFKKNPAPTRVFSTVSEAEMWLTKQLNEEELRLQSHRRSSSSVV